MDNASKALIIAGGILIAIAVISIAVYMFGNARGLVDVSNKSLELAEIQSYNRFYISFPTNITGAEALNIINKALSSNQSESKLSDIHITFNGSPISEVPSELQDSKNYLTPYRYSYKLSSVDATISEINIQ